MNRAPVRREGRLSRGGSSCARRPRRTTKSQKNCCHRDPEEEKEVKTRGDDDGRDEERWKNFEVCCSNPTANAYKKVSRRGEHLVSRKMTSLCLFPAGGASISCQRETSKNTCKKKPAVRRSSNVNPKLGFLISFKT